jgi:RNA polymerase sigma factor (TIGR02999 family)
VSTDGDITGLLAEIRKGNQRAESVLIPLVYEELRRLAGRYMRREHPGHTLQATALVNEAYLKLSQQRSVSWQNRAHFLAIAARVMRRILVDHARARGRDKRGGDQRRVPLEDVRLCSDEQAETLIGLDTALQRLALEHPRQSQVVEMRFFGGLQVDEIAEALQISPKTVKRDWSVARAWLYREIRQENPR